jgi:formimidoylglutamate deiminase
MADERRLFAPRAWTGTGWAADVLLHVGPDGCWSAIRSGCTAQERGAAEVLQGPVVPGLVNGHSHAFQRAIAGLTQGSTGGHDDFWTWRERMYAAALRITPQQLEAIASFLYAELLQGGYTHVCEFHYLHNDVDGRPYADAMEMSMALGRAARRAGIGLTLLPTLYMRAGLDGGALRAEQRRFASTPESVLRIAQALRAAGDACISAGVALHSLRAVDAGALREVAQAAARSGLPVHIHVAEQQQEVQDCLRVHGQPPVEWLLANAPVDARWNLVHATHAGASELEALRATGAGIVLCPGTEADLGDGLFDLPRWLQARGRWCLGSDSHVTRSWAEELRLLEYGQRLALRERNVAARACGTTSTAAALLQGAVEGGSRAAGQALGGLVVGQRADFCVLEACAPSLTGIPDDLVLDAFVFSAPAAAMRRVFVAGQEVHPRPQQHAAAFAAAMHALWAAA